MGKFSIGALFAASTLIALPAAAADAPATVRIAVANKTAAQVLREIDLAATKVCAQAGADAAACYSDARVAAERQFDRLNRKAAAERDQPGAVRISLKGKSRAQIFQEIDAAAATVCKDVSFAEQRECVAEAAGVAKQRLADSGRFNDLALN